MSGAVLNRRRRPLSKLRLAVTAALRDGRWLTTRDVARLTRRLPCTILNTLNGLARDDLILSDCGDPERWRILAAGQAALAEARKK